MRELVLNPNLLVRPVYANGRVAAYSLIGIVRGRGRVQNLVNIDDVSADIARVLEGLVEADTDIEIDESVWAALVDLGVLVYEGDVSRPATFCCRFNGDEGALSASLTVNPDVVITTGADFLTREQGLKHLLAPSEQLILVRDPVTGAHYPYWTDHRELALMRCLVPGGAPPPGVDIAQVGRLARAGILIDEQALLESRRKLDSAIAQFARHGYAELPQILPALQLEALRRYYRTLVDEGYVSEGDSQVHLRFAQHNEPLMGYYHRELCQFFARVAGQPLKPSYGYFASYRRGARLKKHYDREQCTFTVSLLLDYEASPSDDGVWPLYFDLPAAGKHVAVGLAPGDCVLFCGRELAHYREELRAERSASLFLHYVHEAFSGPIH